MLSKSPSRPTFLIEETLGLLHTEDVVEGLLPTHSLEVDVDLSSTSLVKNTNPLNGEVMEDEGEENH